MLMLAFNDIYTLYRMLSLYIILRKEDIMTVNLFFKWFS